MGFNLTELMAAVRQWGYDRNLCTPECIESQMLKQVSEFSETAEGILETDITKVVDGIGDTLVVAILMGERLKHPIAPSVIGNVIPSREANSTCLGSLISLGRLSDLIGKKSYAKATAELENFIMNVCDMARQLGYDPIACLYTSYDEIKDRKGVMYNGMFIKESDPEYARAHQAIQAERLRTDFKEHLGATEVSEVTRLPDGSGCFTASWPLPSDHWIYGRKDGVYDAPPMGMRMGMEHPKRAEYETLIRDAARYAVRGATMSGKESDFDPDALVNNMTVGLLGYYTADGLSSTDVWSNPNPVPPYFEKL